MKATGIILLILGGFIVLIAFVGFTLDTEDMRMIIKEYIFSAILITLGVYLIKSAKNKKRRI